MRVSPGSRPIVTLSSFPTPAPNKALQPKSLGEPHEMVGVLDDNLCIAVCRLLRDGQTPRDG
jgi:hypothetical protein